MTDDRIDALLGTLNVVSRPDESYVTESAATLLARARAARVQDHHRLGRLRRDLAVAMERPDRSALPRWIVVVAVVALLILAATVAAILAGGTRPKILNGPLIVALGGELRAIDPDTGTYRALDVGGGASHVSRSPDGRLIAFWQPGPSGDRLTIAGIDGRDPHAVVAERPLSWAGCVDTWSADSRFVASEVTVDGLSRIVVADAANGTGRFVTPGNLAAHCPLWSPDGRSIAVTEETSPGARVLAIVSIDGSSIRPLSGDLGGLSPSAPDTWSPDGAWIYFDASHLGVSRVYRADVSTGAATPISDPSLRARGPAASPDGTKITFTVTRPDGTGTDLYIADSDGGHARPLLEHAINEGWSADGRFVLTRWIPPHENGGLAVVTLDGQVRIVAAPDEGCPIDTRQVCDMGWGVPRP